MTSLKHSYDQYIEGALPLITDLPCLTAIFKIICLIGELVSPIVLPLEVHIYLVVVFSLTRYMQRCAATLFWDMGAFLIIVIQRQTRVKAAFHRKSQNCSRAISLWIHIHFMSMRNSQKLQDCFEEAFNRVKTKYICRILFSQGWIFYHFV